MDHRAMHAVPVESIPATGTAEHCAEHSGQTGKINVNRMLRCGNMEGCCIKADGPHSTGLNNRLPANDDHALSLSTAQPESDGLLVDALPHRLHTQRNLPGPNPRPPIA